MDAASSVVSVSVTPVYNAADFVCALSQRRMKYTGAIDLGCALERSKLPTLKRSFYDEMAASCRYLDATLQRSGYTGSGSRVQPRLYYLTFWPAPTEPKPVVGKPETRKKKGMEALVQHVTQGFKAMPPRGLCMDCSVEVYRNDHRVMNE